MREELHGYLLAALHQRLEVEGRIVGYDSAKKRWNVVIQGVNAVLPLANNLNQYQKDPEILIGLRMLFWVYSIEGDVVTLIHPQVAKALFEETRSVLKNFKKSQELSGYVTKFGKSGVYISVGKIMGFAYYNSLNDLYLHRDDKVNVIVKKIDLEDCQLELKVTGICKSEADELKEVFSSLKHNQIISGKVVSCSTSFTIIDYKGLNCKIFAKHYATSFREHNALRLQKGDIVEAVVIYKKCTTKHFTPSYNVILSAKEIEKDMENQEQQKQREAILSRFVKGQEYPVKVTDFNKIYAIVDSGVNVPSRILYEDLAGGRIPMEDKVFIGKETDAVFLRYDDGMLFFSTKLLAEKPYDDKLYEADTDELLYTLGITANSFTAQVLEYNGNKYFRYLYADSDENRDNDTDGLLLCDNYTGNQLRIKIPKEYEERFESGCYYSIKIKAIDTESRRNRETPFLFVLDTDSIADTPQKLDNPYRRLVNQTFKKQTSPSQGASLAKLLVEVGDNMYDSKERMFFELLQNADDSSARKGVEVNLESLDGYLILTHDGMPFNRPDFTSITAAARSSKPKTSKKTGYKGIGFKSVFKAYKVYLKTGGFFFKFDSENELYKNFERFYFTVNDITDEAKKAEYLEQYREEKKSFNGIESIPWQLLPEWVNDIPDKLQQTEFSNGENVAIALAMTDATRAEYVNAINDVLQQPKFMLFLRNTNRINYKNGSESFCLAKDKRGEEVSLQSTRPDAPIHQEFIVREDDIIEVSTENFANCGVNIVITQEYNTRTQKEENQFRNQEGERIDSIPPRISDSDNTLISYAIPIDDNNQFVPLNQSTTLFAYLPMTENRYPFPIYINADFIMKSSREGVQSENPWNYFLFYNIGKDYIKWIAKAASTNQPNYLNLLLSKYFDDKAVGMTKLSSFFNKGYKGSLHSEAFILNDKAELVKMSQIIIDHTGLSQIIDPDEYCFIAGKTDKRLPYPKLNIEILDGKSMFDEIEHISSLDSKLLNIKIRKYIRSWIMEATEEERVLANKWLIDNKKSNLIKPLPLFEFDDKYYSIDEVEQSENLLFLCGNLMKLDNVLDKLHILCCDDDITSHLLYATFLKDKDFEKTCTKRAISKIIERTEKYNTKLTCTEKALVFSIIAGTCKDLKCEDKIGKWKLFCNMNGQNMALSDMCQATEDPAGNDLLSDIIISSEEQNAVVNGLKKWLMASEDIYPSYIYPNWESIISKWLSLNAHEPSPEDSLQHIYYIVQKLYDAADTANKLKQANGDRNIIILKDISSQKNSAYILSRSEFVQATEVFYNKALAVNQTAYNVIHRLFVCSLPAFDCITSFKDAPFKTTDDKLSKLTLQDDVVLNSDDMYALLDYCVQSKDDFFAHFKVRESNGSYSISKLAEDEWNFYDTSADFRAHVIECCTNAVLLPLSLSRYNTIEGLTTTESVFEKLFESSENETDKLLEHLKYVLEESKSIKLSYVSYFETLVINHELFTDNSNFTRLFSMLAQLSGEDGFTDEIRDKIRIPDVNGIEIPLSEISMQGTVSIDNMTFDLDTLYPEDNQTIQDVAANTLAVMRRQGIRNEFLNELFNLDETISDTDVFNSLNKSASLQNGEQLAFMLKYCYITNNTNAYFLLKDKLGNTHGIKDSCWVVSDASFIDESHILSPIYDGFTKLLTKDEKTNLPLGIKLYEAKSIYRFVKTVLTREEKNALLDSLLCLWDTEHKLLSDLETEQIKTALGVNNPIFILADRQYLLSSEQLPQDILDWINVGKSSRVPFVVSELGIPDGTCDVITIRKFLISEISEPDILTLSDNAQQQTCDWISERKISLSNSQYAFLSKVLSDDYIQRTVNIDKLKECINETNVMLRFSRYTIYDCHDSIPYKVDLPKNNYYVCHQYQEGDVWIDGNNIFINDNCIDLDDGMLQLTNSNLLDAKDYVIYLNTPKDYLGTVGLEGGLDTDPNDNRRKARNDLAKKEAKIWLQEHGYTIIKDFGDYDDAEVEDNNHIIYPIIVKCFSETLFVNPNEWFELIRPNSRLILYRGHNRISVTTREQLLKFKEFLFLRIHSGNFDEDNEKLSESLDNIAKCLHYFKRTHIIIQEISSGTFRDSTSLEDLGLYKCATDVTGQSNDIDDII